MSEDTAGRYDHHSREQLIDLLEQRDRSKKLGLVWERDQIDADQALEAEFIAADLEPAKSYPTSGGGWNNLVLEGDNFDSLRWLRMTLAGRVKCIYVDPPYNTGNRDWVYNDRYRSKDDRYAQSTWLEFLYRRFSLARDLLTEDGVILVSINDDNRAKLELMLDDVLPGMRKGTLTWRTRVGGNEGGEAFLSDNHEHVLVYGAAGFRFGGTEKSFEMYRFSDVDGEEYRVSDLTVAVAHNDKRAGQAYYPLHDPEADIWYPANPDRVWAYVSRARSGEKARIKTKFMEDWVREKRIAFPVNPRTVRFETRAELVDAVQRGEVPASGGRPSIRPDLPEFDEWVGRTIGFGAPGFKRYKKDLKNPTQPLSSWITPQSEKETTPVDENAISAATNEEGTKAIKELFGDKAFNYPKPPSLIRGLLEQATSPGDLVLDFFAGSATTAQAVMELNARDGGGRRFVMASSTERTTEQPDKNLCDQVTAERVRRLNAASEPPYAELNAPFAYLRMVPVAFEDIDYDLTPGQAWTALETLHGLAVTPHPGGAWAMHEGEETALVLVDRVDDALIATLKGLAERRANAFVYAWAPAQVTTALGGTQIEVRPLRETLVQRFRR